MSSRTPFLPATLCSLLSLIHHPSIRSYHLSTHPSFSIRPSSIYICIHYLLFHQSSFYPSPSVHPPIIFHPAITQSAIILHPSIHSSPSTHLLYPSIIHPAIHQVNRHFLRTTSEFYVAQDLWAQPGERPDPYCVGAYTLERQRNEKQVIN